jgi:CubicO group peptidase (beta-lactamase class C family)
MKDPPNAERRIFGPSPLAFGQPGAGGSHAFADLENKLAFAYVMNQMEQKILPNEKSLRLVDALYRLMISGSHRHELPPSAGERDAVCGARERPKPERSGRSVVTFSNSFSLPAFLDLFRRSPFSSCESHRKVEAVVEIGRGERADEERGRQQHLRGGFFTRKWVKTAAAIRTAIIKRRRSRPADD